MSILKTLTARAICLDLQAESKDDLLREMVDLLVASGELAAAQRPAALAALRAREESMSTGMPHGLAIPHAKTDAVDRLMVALGIKREGLDFDALDGQPSFIFVMTLSPRNRTGPHIQFLAEISRLINDAAFQRRLRACTAPGQALALIQQGGAEKR